MKETTQQIIELLQKGASQRSLVKRGFPLSTVRYHHKKLFRPDAYERLKARQKKYNTPKTA